MPEGPEIRRAADRVEKAVADRELVAVELHFEDLRASAAQLVGQQVTRVDTHGKAMLTHFSAGKVLYSHNQLYGRWRIAAPDADPKTNRRLRVALRTEHRSALLYSATDVDLLDSEELAVHPYLRGLGPDPLWAQTTVEEIADRFASRTFRRRRLAGLLLDQSCIAGQGAC
ncbi:MAG: hypothetical protein DWQ36_15715 [Acidobacteria bacterium]|nr:MAG: hypothetical protein DWQ30_01460 [Acidobacteriota bacterium]REK05949.1 MAG: hypothetical protein DWQ36_15715 [Acidobacteriota bacterium]